MPSSPTNWSKPLAVRSVELLGLFASAYTIGFRCLVCYVHLIFQVTVSVGNLSAGTSSDSALNMHINTCLCQAQACRYLLPVIVFSKAMITIHPYLSVAANVACQIQQEENHAGLNTTSHFPRTYLSNLPLYSSELSFHLLS